MHDLTEDGVLSKLEGGRQAVLSGIDLNLQTYCGVEAVPSRD
jgi:hypothetical protein